MGDRQRAGWKDRHRLLDRAPLYTRTHKRRTGFRSLFTAVEKACNCRPSDFFERRNLLWRLTWTWCRPPLQLLCGDLAGSRRLVLVFNFRVEPLCFFWLGGLIQACELQL